MSKKILLSNFGYLLLLMILVISIAAVFIPTAQFVPKNGNVEAHWISNIIALNDINLIVYFSIVTLLCLVYLIRTILFVKRNYKTITSQMDTGSKEDKMLVFSLVLTFLSMMAFLLSISITPYVTASYRQPLYMAAGEELNILVNHAINNTVYYAILSPVFIAIIPLGYSIGLAIYLEVINRIKEHQQNKQKK